MSGHSHAKQPVRPAGLAPAGLAAPAQGGDSQIVELAGLCDILIRQSAAGNQETHAPAWKIRALEQEFGPLTLNDLLKMARRGGLAARDEVFYPRAAQWVLAGAVPELADAIAAPLRHELDAMTIHSEAASTAVNAANRKKAFDSSAPDTVVAQAPPAMLAAAEGPPSVTCAPKPLTRVVSQPPQVRARPLPFKKRQPTRGSLSRRSIMMSAAACAGVAMIAMGMWMFRSPSDEMYYHVIQDVWTQAQDLRGRNVSDTEWHQFAVASRARLEPIIADLEERASSREPARQNMLWASRDYLLPLLSQGRLANKSLLNHLTEQMETAEQLLLAGGSSL